jgi:hypothetical protein
VGGPCIPDFRFTRSPSRPIYRSEGAPRGVGNSRLKAKIATFVDLAAMLIAVAMGRGAVRELLDRDRSSVPAQELAAEQIGGAKEAARPGFRTVSKPDRGFSIDLPEAMDELPIMVQTLDENVALLESLNPTLASALKGNTALLDQVRLFAIDRETCTTQVIQRVRAGRGADIDDVPRGTFSGEYGKYGAASADEAMVRLPAGNALLVSAQLPMGPSTVSVTQYVLAHNGYAWILTTSGANSAKDGADIAATFRFE